MSFSTSTPAECTVACTEQWPALPDGEILGDTAVAAATLDRLLHRSVVINVAHYHCHEQGADHCYDPLHQSVTSVGRSCRVKRR
jgi:hypothetical protein